MSRTIDKVMRVLDLFSLERPEWGVSEAAKALGFPKSTTSEGFAPKVGVVHYKW